MPGTSTPNLAAWACVARPDLFVERCRTTHDAGYPIFTCWRDSRNDVRGDGRDGALFVGLGLPAGIRASALTQVPAADFERNVAPGTLFGSPSDGAARARIPPASIAIAVRRGKRVV